jgi:hypothetical protein
MKFEVDDMGVEPELEEDEASRLGGWSVQPGEMKT